MSSIDTTFMVDWKSPDDTKFVNFFRELGPERHFYLVICDPAGKRVKSMYVVPSSSKSPQSITSAINAVKRLTGGIDQTHCVHVGTVQTFGTTVLFNAEIYGNGYPVDFGLHALKMALQGNCITVLRRSEDGLEN